ncbi:ATP-binding protein [Vibrio alginolyticus]|nr:ATP-binding protein [Vibrio alginolyticus]
MLLTYRLDNYKGFGEKQELNLIATARNEFPESLYEINENIRANLSSCIIGPNGAGKTHLMESLFHCANSIRNNDIKESFQPFLLGENNKNEPTSYELLLYSKELNEFLTYSFSVIRGVVIKENLETRLNEKNAKSRTIFYRSETEIVFSADLKDAQALIAPNIKATGLVVGFANSIENKHLEFIVNWAKGVFFFNPRIVRNMGGDLINSIIHGVLTGLLDSDIEEQTDIIRSEKGDKFLSSVFDIATKTLKECDVPVTGFEVGENEIGEYHLKVIPKKLKVGPKPMTLEDAENYFSEGSYNLITLVLVSIMTSFENRLILLDEIDGSFHHKLTKKVIDLIRSSNGQLILTTHDILMLDYDFRRDAVFTITKNETLLSKINRISDYSIRKDAKLSAKYFNDEFGALPKIVKSDNDNN